MNLEKELERIWKAISRLDKLLYGNGEEKGMKVKLENIVAIKRYNKWLIGVFCVALFIGLSQWAKIIIREEVRNQNIEIVEMMNELDYKIAERNEISPELIKKLTEKVDELLEIANKPLDIEIEF